MNLKKARNTLERSAKGAISYVDNKGYRWYIDYFLPAIKKMESQHRTTCRDRYLIFEAHYINGDVHDFNDAPQAAIRSYQRCLALDPKAGGAWREMGRMYDYLGHSKEAIKCLKKAVEVDPTDDNNTSDLKLFMECGPMGKMDSISHNREWRAREALAALHPRAALLLLKRANSSRIHQLKARAFGALGDVGAVIQEWEAIANRSDKFSWESGDWFYVPDNVCNKSLRFWEAQRKIWRRWNGKGTTIGPDNLWKIIPSYRHRWLMIIWFHIAELKRDSLLAQKICARYPKWKAANDLARKLKSEK